MQTLPFSKKNQSYLLFNPQIFWMGAKCGKIFSLSLPCYVFYQLILALTAWTRLNSSITYSLLNIRDRRLARVSLTCILFRFSGNWKHSETQGPQNWKISQIPFPKPLKIRISNTRRVKELNSTACAVVNSLPTDLYLDGNTRRIKVSYL